MKTEELKPDQVWDNRYDVDEYVYGRDANVFLQQNAARIPKGKVLCLAEGEGRNAVYLAKLGYQVTAVDFSRIGQEKTKQLLLSDSDEPNPARLNRLLLADAFPGELEYREADAALLCHACRLRYRIEDDIPVMLIDEATPIEA